MMNKTINCFIDNMGSNFLRELVAQTVPEKTVILNGDKWFDTRTGRPTISITILDCDKSLFSKIKQRKFIKDLKLTGNIKNFGA